MSATQVISSDYVLLPGSERRLGRAHVHIAGTRIVAVEESTSPSVPEGAEHIDLGPRWLTPAFVNAHTHLALAFIRSLRPKAGQAHEHMVEDFFYQLEEHLEPEDVLAFSRMGAYESLLNGVGFVWDHYFFGEAIAEAMLEVGLAGAVAPTLQDIKGPGHTRVGEELAATIAIHEATRLADAGIVAALGPHAPDTVSDALWAEVLEQGEQLGLPIHAHLAQSLPEYEESLRGHGVSPVRRLKDQGALNHREGAVFAHAIFADLEDLELIAEAKARLVWCPNSALVFGLPARTDVWREVGVEFAVATDCAASNDGMGVQHELRHLLQQPYATAAASPAYLEFLRSGSPEAAHQAWQQRAQGPQPPEGVLHRIWETPGAWHPQAPCGEIAPGKLANLLAWDPTHPSLWPARDLERSLSMTQPSGALHAMWVGGKAIGEVGNLQRSLVESEQYRKSLKAAEKALDALLLRAKIPGLG